MTRKAIDIASNAGPSAALIRSNAIDLVVRYYTKYPGGKCISQTEAVQLSSAGLHIAVIYQDYNNAASRFSAAVGAEQGAKALSLAGAISQPRNSAIYFSVDFDASTDELDAAIIPHFAAIQNTFAAAGSGYKIGAYGSGLTLATLLDRGLIEYCWLSMSTGHGGYKAFKESMRWHLLQTKEVRGWNGLNVDLDDVTDVHPDVGEFVPDGLNGGRPQVLDSQAEASRAVNARDGLNLRGGPGIEFPTIRRLPFGTNVYVLGRESDWARVDLKGDGKADGYMFASYLS